MAAIRRKNILDVPKYENALMLMMEWISKYEIDIRFSCEQITIAGDTQIFAISFFDCPNSTIDAIKNYINANI